MENNPKIDPKYELPLPHDMQLPNPHDMQIASHITHKHTWLHWLPAIFGLMIGLFVGIFMISGAKENREDINPSYTTPKPTNSYTSKTNNIQWLTYTNNIYNYSLSYPNSWNVSSLGKLSVSVIDSVSFDPIEKDQVDSSVIINIITREFAQANINSDTTTNQSVLINNIQGIRKEFPFQNGIQIVVYLPVANHYISIGANKDEEAIFNNMLSSFSIQQLISPTIIPSIIIPTPNTNVSYSCTLDTKQCADGTWVSRVGPNCEFLPCPTP